MNNEQLNRIEEAVYKNSGALAALTDIVSMVAKGEACLAGYDLKIRHQRFHDPGPPPTDRENFHWQGYMSTVERFERTYKVMKYGSPDDPFMKDNPK